MRKSPRRIKSTDTHCANGHAWTPETAYVYPKSKVKVCRLCRKSRKEKHENTIPVDRVQIDPRNFLGTDGQRWKKKYRWDGLE
jgi:hypothetical protein